MRMKTFTAEEMEVIADALEIAGIGDKKICAIFQKVVHLIDGDNGEINIELEDDKRVFTLSVTDIEKD